eukprot:scaffold55962_cov33-Tisochrysis_lutea.AAC.1
MTNMRVRLLYTTLGRSMTYGPGWLCGSTMDVLRKTIPALSHESISRDMQAGMRGNESIQHRWLQTAQPSSRPVLCRAVSCVGPHPFVCPSLVYAYRITASGKALLRLAIPIDNAIVHNHLAAVRVDLGAVRVIECGMLARDGGQIGCVEDVERSQDNRDQRADRCTTEPATAVSARLAPSANDWIRRLAHTQVASNLLLPPEVGDVVARKDGETAPTQQRTQADLRGGEVDLLFEERSDSLPAQPRVI